MANPFSHFFQPKGQEEALARYGKFATGSAWSVPHKMDLYDSARTAFDEAVSDDAAFEAFEKIYGSLSSYWQVFRPQGASRCWSSRQIFDAVRKELAEYS